MTDEKTSQTTEPAAAEPQQQPAQTEPPTWFSDYSTKVEEQLQQLRSTVGRLRENVSAGTPQPKAAAPTEPPAEQAGPSHADVAAAVKLGQLSAGLPEPAMAKVTERAEAGDFRGALELAELARSIAESAKPVDAEKQRRAPKAFEATSRNSSTAYPKSLAEWRELKTKDRAAFDALDRDPNFNPAHLHRSKR